MRGLIVFFATIVISTYAYAQNDPGNNGEDVNGGLQIVVPPDNAVGMPSDTAPTDVTNDPPTITIDEQPRDNVPTDWYVEGPDVAP